ncbi:MAG TPA: triple tyrosine motif-containing protein, partial [Chitinophagaceae bacterium]|nr:triple tyrosine motif-containing protein [Chitinophagaceae bacterium]
KRIFGFEDGLKDPGVYKIYPIAEKTLAVSSNTGLALLDIKHNKIKMIFESDGLNTDQFEEYSGYQAGGKVFFGGLNGVSLIDPKAITTNKKAPILYFTGINVQTSTGAIDTTNIGIRKFIVPTNRRQTNVYFVGLNYSDPSAVTYQYRIKEKDTSWTSLGKQNFISIIGIEPNTYSLQIRAANEDGIWSAPGELTLVFLPKWYQTNLFKISLALLAASIIYLIYRIRIAQIKKEERIRSRLASDLHDDLGSTFNSIKVYSNLALMQPGDTGYLHKIKEGTQDAINGIRDMIWVLDDKKDTVGDILSRIQQFAIPLCEAEGIVFNMNVDAGLNHHKLGKEEKRNLYLMLKEGINNSIKYAGCSAITLSVASTGNKLSVTIADNGKGFDPNEMKQGNGLKNIPARAAEIGYRYNINTSKGNGVVLRFDKI